MTENVFSWAQRELFKKLSLEDQEKIIDFYKNPDYDFKKPNEGRELAIALIINTSMLLALSEDILKVIKK